MCSKRHTTLLIEGLESIDSFCKRRTRSLNSQLRARNGRSTETLRTVLHLNACLLIVSQNYMHAFLTYVLTRARVLWRNPAVGAWCSHRGSGDAERALAVARFQGHAYVGKQAVSGNVRQAQRDAPINAAKASVTVAISPLPPPSSWCASPPGRSGRRSTRRCLTHRLPVGVADRFALSATGPAAFSRSLPINFRLRLLSFPLLVVRCAPFPWLRC